MIQVEIGCDRDGLVRSLRSSGHAMGVDKGNSLACGIVSSALRSFARVTGSQTGIIVSGTADRPGSFEMTTGDVTVAKQGWYRGASEVLIQALRDVQTDFPDRIGLNIYII